MPSWRTPGWGVRVGCQRGVTPRGGVPSGCHLEDAGLAVEEDEDELRLQEEGEGTEDGGDARVAEERRDGGGVREHGEGEEDEEEDYEQPAGEWEEAGRDDGAAEQRHEEEGAAVGEHDRRVVR